MKAAFTIFAAGLALVLQGGFACAYATNASAHCTGMTVTDFVSSDHDSATSSTRWQNLTDGHLNFVTSGIGCVTITFSAPAKVSASGSGFNTLHVRTLLDGNNLCVPALYDDRFLESLTPTPITANSITRVCKNVPAGAHSLQVQFRADDPSYTVYIFSSVLTVTHG